MNYPGDFNTSAFPAGKSIAVSRFMSIGTLVAFFCIVCLCGALIWVSRSRTIDPFLISVNWLTGQWSLIGHDKDKVSESTEFEAQVQESVVGNFAQNWFFISDNADYNALLWATCNRQECGGAENIVHGRGNSAICCGAGEKLYGHFISDVMPDYALRGQLGERWILDFDSMIISPVAAVTAAGGTWRITANVNSNVSGVFKILAFVKVVRNTDYYPMTLGYYVADFNAYRI